jgi:hypothetical protein
MPSDVTLTFRRVSSASKRKQHSFTALTVPRRRSSKDQTAIPGLTLSTSSSFAFTEASGASLFRIAGHVCPKLTESCNVRQPFKGLTQRKRLGGYCMVANVAGQTTEPDLRTQPYPRGRHAG